MWTTPHSEGASHVQSEWRWCHKCCALFWGGAHAVGGHCITGGAHDGSRGTSANYYLPMMAKGDIVCAQPGWHYCSFCAALVWRTRAASGYECVRCQSHTRGRTLYALSYQ